MYKIYNYFKCLKFKIILNVQRYTKNYTISHGIKTHD